MVSENYTPQAKICGLTIPEEARQCAELGAAAIGLVFYPPSPRHVELDQAREICAALPGHVPAVGVFVNPTWEMVSQAIEQCPLGGVQLHGNEPADLAARLRATYSIKIVKALFASKAPGLTEASRYEVNAYLVECGKGRLPGGNAMVWDWGSAADFAHRYTTILAGGLAPDNVAQAIAAALPHAVDASSSLESAPGRKDLSKVEAFLTSVRQTAGLYAAKGKILRQVF
jgi:phosphoribosylanthranilate isomerase